MLDLPSTGKKITGTFNGSARAVGAWLGTSQAFAVAIFGVLLWAVSGPFYHFSDSWSLIINTGTTIVTFLMVFVLQNTQNRDTAAIQLKLDELIRAIPAASNALLAAEEKAEDELRAMKDAAL